MTAASPMAATGTSTPSNMATNSGSPASPPSAVVVVIVVVVVVVVVVDDVVIVVEVVGIVDVGVSEVMSAVGVGTVSGASVSVDPVLFVAMSVNARVCEVRGWKALLS